MSFRTHLRRVRLYLSCDPSKERNRWVAQQLEAIPVGKRILDVGCGDQPYRQAASHLEYRAQDFGLYDGRGSGEGFHRGSFNYGKLDYVGDCWDIHEENETFDVILCTEVLEHIPYPGEAIAEFGRLLRPGGTLILTTPYASVPHMNPYFFFAGFSREYFEKMFAKAQLELRVFETNGNAASLICSEMLRMRKLIHGRLNRFLFHVMAVPIILLLLITRQTRNANLSYLPMGHFVVAEKTLDVSSQPK